LIEQFDIRAACLHLIYAAHATQLERPWEQSFVLSDTQLERYLGLDKNHKLNKQQKLELMLELAKQPCHLLVYVSWPEKEQLDRSVLAALGYGKLPSQFCTTKIVSTISKG
jgi:hypothetical protein